MYKSLTPSKIRILKVTDLILKSGQLVAMADLLDENNVFLGVYNMPGFWSDETRKALDILIKSVENDMAKEQFGEGNKINAVIEPEEYEEAMIHEHIEYTPERSIDNFDIEGNF